MGLSVFIDCFLCAAFGLEYCSCFKVEDLSDFILIGRINPRLTGFQAFLRGG
ncbi:hypothetical protein SynROS8604_00129 [Synechococcus sp. ROS8604]|nr:hypothetical protein SynROS8604_00129 [Synechococcus sp. ROS8604]